MKYTCETRKFRAKWITAPQDMLEKLEAFPRPEQRAGKWIWPQAYVREHIRREFWLEEGYREASLELWCDNAIDVYVNGILVSEGRNYTDVIPIIDYLKKGKNMVAVRAYQTASPLRFTSAMRGGIHVLYPGEREYHVLTDEEWHAYEVSNFHRSYEPEEWATMDNPGRAGREERSLCCCEIHPRLLRRSCYFIKKMHVSKAVKSVRLYVTALGLYEAYVNGSRTDDAVLSPGAMEKYQEYQAIDVTRLIRQGENVIAFLMGNGWYNCTSWGELRAGRPAVLGEAEIIYQDGDRELVATDESWLAAASPITDNDIQFGERYDARMEVKEWDEAAWVPVEAREISPEEKRLIYQNYPPVRRTCRLAPVSSRMLNEKCILYDFGANIAGRSHVVMRNCGCGDVIKIQYCERLDEEGIPCIGPYVDVFFPDDCFPGGKAPYARRNMDVYICKGAQEEIYEPRFTYTGFRYIYVECAQPENIQAEAVVMHTDLEESGRIDTEYLLIPKVWEIITRSYRGNIFSGPTDCPTREKNFWNGDIQAFAHTACWYMDNSRFLARWSDGGRKLEADVYGWEDEEYILPLVLYQFYGDREILRIKYPIAARLLEVRQKKMQGDLPLGMRAPYRDHLAVDNGMSSDFFACCYYCLSLKEMSRMADILGYEEDSRRLEGQFHEARTKFLELYYNPENGDFGQECQGGQVLPLAFGLADEREREKVMERLLYYIAKAGYHLTTGFLATEHLLRLLCDFGHADIAWKIFTQKDFPSWQYILDTKATTMTEDWYGNATKSKYSSLNHFALGSVGRWFFEYLGGIRVDESEPGFEKIVMKPLFVEEIGHYKVSYNSARGAIESEWEYKDEEIIWRLKIPDGTTAIAFLPDGQHLCEKSCEFTFSPHKDNRQVI